MQQYSFILSLWVAFLLENSSTVTTILVLEEGRCYNTILQEPRHEEMKEAALRTQSKLVVELTKLQVLAQVLEAFKIPWGREWLPTPVFSPGEFHGQRRLGGYSPWGCRVGPDWATNTLTTLKGNKLPIAFSSCNLLKVLVFETDFACSFIVQVWLQNELKKILIWNFAHTKRRTGERYIYRTKVWNNM